MSASQTRLSDPELLARLVAFDSTSHHSNLPIADFLADYLDRPGIRIERNPSPDGDKVNLVVSVGPEVDPQSRAGLVLSGHMDVVPADEPDWNSDPFQLLETDKGYVGRGACDMKGFVALATNLAVDAAAQRLGAPLVLVLTYDEELGTLGARHFAHSWPLDERPLPRAAVIGEPTSLHAVRLHKGHAKLRLTVHGDGAHSGYPHLGHNAIEPAARAVVALSQLRAELESEACPNGEHFPEVPYVALNVARIKGGNAINIVPKRCQVDLGFRVLPGMRAAAVEERARAVIERALQGERFELVAFDESPALELAEDHPLYRHLCDLLGQQHTVSASYATDGGWLQEAGLDCLLFGPGTIEVAHKPNEILPKDELVRAAGLVRQLADHYCGAAFAG